MHQAAKVSPTVGHPEVALRVGRCTKVFIPASLRCAVYPFLENGQN